ncbi:MAG: hypothetical protein ACR65R_16985 [Methylomicrobium sp.]
MKNIKIKLLTVIGLLSMTYPFMSSAHDQSQSLGVAASATDVYEVDCASAPKLFFEIKSILSSSSPVSAQVINDTVALSTTDSRGGDTESSPALEVVKPGNSAIYTVVVNKTAAGAANYAIEFHCENSDGSHASITEIALKQDQ